MKGFIKNNRIAIDIETSGLRPFQHKLHLISIGNENAQQVYNYHCLTNELGLNDLREMLEDRSIEKVGHNIAFDALWLAVKLDCRPVNLYDTMVMEKVALGGRWLGDSDDTSGHGMAQYNLYNTLKRNHFPVEELPDKSITKSFIGYEGTEFTQVQLDYAKDDIKFLLPLRDKQWKKIIRFDLEEVALMEKRFTEVLVHIQRNGINFDLRRWLELYNDNKELRKKAEKYLVGKKFINWASPQQVLEALHSFDINVPDTNSNTSKYFIRDNKLNKTKRTILERLLEYRLYNKRATSFGSGIVTSVDPDMRIRGNFNQLLATGRMSMMKPNLQQIPSPPEYRACFKASEGKVLVSADYSSQELVIIATGSGEQVWLDAIKEGKDLHSMSAELIFGERWEEGTVTLDGINLTCNYQKSGKKCNCPDHIEMRDAAKTLSFGLAYGLTPKGYALRMGITQDEGQDLYDKYFDAFPKVGKWLDKNAAFTKDTSDAFTFEPFKRWRRVTDAHNYRKQNIGRNTPIQGTGGDCMKLAAIKVYNFINKHDVPAKILLLIHDEILTECEPEYAEEWGGVIKKCMEDAAEVILEHRLLKAEPVISKVWKKD